MKIIVIGSINVDYIGTTKYELMLGESHPGSVSIQAGGVARNIVENLARVKADVTFVTAVGNDFYGQKYKSDLEELGVKIIMPKKTEQYNSSIYLAINDKEGQMVYSVVNTDIVSLTNKEYISTIIDTINTFDYVLIDTNLDSDTIDYLFEKVNKPIICDAVSTIKADKLRNHLDKIYILKVNENEYSHLESDLNENIPTNLIITNGSKPVIYITKPFTKQYQPKQKEDIKSTTGAGDSFVAGVISGILDGLQIEDGIKRGLDFSYQTLDVTGAVNPNIKKG